MSKIIYTIAIIILFMNSLNAQSRKVLFEEGTNASCAPCAASNPILIAWLQNHQAQGYIDYVSCILARF